MLYDQALLVRAYLHAWMVTGNDRYRRVVEETITYVLRDLRHADGGFFSAEDADSEGVEGRFYVWSLEELEAVSGDDLPELVRHFGVTARGNFEDPHTGFRGNILHARPDRRHPRRVAGSPKLFAAPQRGASVDDRCCSRKRAFLRFSLRWPRFGRGDDWPRAHNAQFLLRELRRDDGRLLRSAGGRANLLRRRGLCRTAGGAAR
jgi:uncharacterized protein YyaL (SSP411 family)